MQYTLQFLSSFEEDMMGSVYPEWRLKRLTLGDATRSSDFTVLTEVLKEAIPSLALPGGCIERMESV
jgi:hypothetical protein